MLAYWKGEPRHINPEDDCPSHGKGSKVVTRWGLQRISAWNLFTDRRWMPFRTSTASCAHSKWKSHGLFRLVKGIYVFLFTGVVWWCCGLFVVTFSRLWSQSADFLLLVQVFENLLRRFLRCRYFRGRFEFLILLTCHDGAFWELRLRIHFPWEFSLQWIHCFLTVRYFIMSDEIHGLYRHGAVICNLSNSIFWGNASCFYQNYLKLWLWIV